MARYRTSNEIAQSLLEFYRIAQPNLSTQPGEPARDLFIDGDSFEIAKLYDELRNVAMRQSPKNSIGSDLDNFLSNFKEFKRKGTKAQVIALLTFDSLESDLLLTKGSRLFAKNGLTFILLNDITLNQLLLTTYQATASKFKADLDFLGITDKYAVSVLAEASVAGSQGRISKYFLNSSELIGINHVTNVFPASGGFDPETDAQAKNRFFSILAGGSPGTSLGYKSIIISDPDVLDAEIIEPGDPLMIRDGTQVFTKENGEKIIVSEGSGGKTDIIVFGSRLEESSDSYIYRDLSNTGSPTNTLNDYVIGQIADDKNKTISRKRLDNLKNKILPNQPVNNISSVEGSISGPNFKIKEIDQYGRVSGNYELIADNGNFGGSPWGSDKLHWISDRISKYPEDKTKNILNGQEILAYSDVTQIHSVTQNITISNENSKINPKNRSILELKHFPCTAVVRVFNVTTGERYVVTNQNLDGDGNINLTGRISISGRTLPAVSDILQVDYTWIFNYDPNFDFNNKLNSNSIRDVGDSIDWGYSNFVRKERAVLSLSGDFFKIITMHDISSVSSVNTFIEQNANTQLKSNRMAIVVNEEVKNVDRIMLSNGLETWNTKKNDGTFNGFVIFLPTDSLAFLGENVKVIYNTNNIYNENSNFNEKNILISSDNTSLSGEIVECNYIANVTTLLPQTTLSNLPAIKNNNEFQVLSTKFGNQPCSFIFDELNILNNSRLAPTNLGISISGNISSGSININGQILIPILDQVMTISSNGLKQDLSSAIKQFLKISSKDILPENYKIAKIVKFEKVNTFSNSSKEVISTDYEFDLHGYQIFDNYLNKYYSVSNLELKKTECILPNTKNNLLNNLSIGDKVKVSIYLAADNQTETLFFSKQGIQYTQNKFVWVDIINISSGFSDNLSQNSTISVFNLNQPATKSRYRAFYDYLAPKPNERITIKYNFDRIIKDLSLKIEEKSRNIGSDVILKIAKPVLIDAIAHIIVLPEFELQDSNLIAQNSRDVIINYLRFKRGTVDISDLNNIIYTVGGVDRVRFEYFNKSGNIGSVLSLTTEKNEFLFPNNIIVKIEKRIK